MRNGISLVRFTPVTGRTHQIRVHAASGLGIPLVGDPVYGKADPRTRRTMLHAAMIALLRENKPPVTASSPLPVDFGVFGFDQLHD